MLLQEYEEVPGTAKITPCPVMFYSSYAKRIYPQLQIVMFYFIYYYIIT